MGIGGIGIWQLLIILVIVLLLFGTKRLKGLGGDLGGAIKGFKKAITDEEANKEKEGEDADAETDPKKVTEAEKQEAPKDTSKSETKQS